MSRFNRSIYIVLSFAALATGTGAQAGAIVSGSALATLTYPDLAGNAQSEYVSHLFDATTATDTNTPTTVSATVTP